MPAFGCKETPGNGLVSGYPSPRPRSNRLKGRKVSPFSRGVGRPIVVPVPLEKRWRPRFCCWNQIRRLFGKEGLNSMVIFVQSSNRFLSNRWRYVKKMRNFMEFATISISKLRPVLPVDWRKKRHVDHHSLTSRGGTAPHCQRSQGVSWQKLRRKWRFQICYKDYFKVSLNKLKSKCNK